MLPQEWYENGKQLEIAANRLAYFKAGLSQSPEFHPYAWRGIGDALQEQGDMSGASEALANEEKARRGLESATSTHLQESLSGSKPLSNDARFCPACGSPVPSMAQYCARCGESLSAGGLERPIQSPQYAQSYPRYNQNAQASGYGLAGLIVAIIGFFVASIPLGIVALVLGGVGSSKDRKKNLATGALCVGAIDLIVGLIMFVMLMSSYHYY